MADIKKLFIFSILFFMLVSFIPVSVSAKTNAGIGPSSFFYVFDITFEKIDLFFTFNPEKKAKKALKYADERLAEAEESANKNKPKAVEKAMEDYKKKISLATEKSKELKDEKKTEELLNIISGNTLKHQKILESVLKNVPEEARQAIRNAIEISKKGQEEAVKQITELKGKVEKLKKEVEELKAKNKAQTKEIKKQQSESTSAPAKSSTPSISTNKTTSKASTITLSNSQIIKKVKPAVVYIETDAGTGSGMVISSDGFILTNAHVVQNSATAQITLSNGSIYLASVVGRDENVDLAILKINVQNLQEVKLGDSNTVEQGDEVFTLGYPFGIKGDVSFKEGTISRKIVDGVNSYLETSAEIHPGNSGGPLINTSGNVIGVNSASFGQSIKGIVIGETIKFAIPINIVKGLIPELKAGRQVIVPKTETPLVDNPFQVEDSNLKIVKCQAKTRVQTNSMKQLLYKQAEDGFGKNIADAEEGIRKSKLEQAKRLSEFDESLLGLSPEQQSSIRESRVAAVQPTIDYYVSIKQKNIQLLKKAKDIINRSIEQSYNELYLKCINK